MRLNHYKVLGLERPAGIIGTPAWAEDMTYLLPREAQDKGMVMIDISYKTPVENKDPVSIFDRDGKILHTWPDDYVPGFFEVQNVARRLLK